MGPLQAHFGVLWGHFGVTLTILGGTWRALGDHWELVGTSLGVFWGLKWFGGGILGHMRATVGHFSGTDDTLEPLWGPL